MTDRVPVSGPCPGRRAVAHALDCELRGALCDLLDLLKLLELLELLVTQRYQHVKTHCGPCPA